MTDAELFNLRIEQLCRKHSILWRRDCSRQSQSRGVCDPAHDLAEIHTTPIRSAISYASALHEIGHALGRHRNSRRIMMREAWAWRWARAHAMVWTPAMERSRQKALAWYAPRAAGYDAKVQAEMQKEMGADAHDQAP
jgi:hypothetical protein